MTFKVYLTGSTEALIPLILSLDENIFFLKLEKLQYPKTPVLTLLAAKRFIKISHYNFIFLQNCPINDIITILGAAICTLYQPKTIWDINFPSLL